jgi:hypothetical protein
MNKFWVKIAIFAVIVVGLVVLINVFSKSEPKPEPETFYDAVEKDRQRFLTEPKPEEPAKQDAQPADQQTFEEDRAEEPTKPVKLYFAELSEIDAIEAERFLNIAVPGRSIGRLPMTGFKLMVDNCRRIIRKWPDSWYAYRAKQMLADMPVRFRKRYNITEEELDLSRFAESRPGTKLFVIEGSD